MQKVFSRLYTGIVVFATVAPFMQKKAAASEVYSIQMGAFSTAESAQNAKEETGLPSLHVQQMQGSGPFKLLLGHFGTYADAWAAKTRLPEGTDAFIVTWDDGGEEAKTTSPVGPFDTRGLRKGDGFSQANGVFDNSEVARPAPELLGKGLNSLAREELLSVGFHPQSNSQGIQGLQEFLSKYPLDPQRNSAALRLARRLLAQKKYEEVKSLLDEVELSGTSAERGRARLIRAYQTLYADSTTEAYKAFCDVANDQSNPGDVRRDAMRRAAAVAHASGHYPEALQAYAQLEQVSDGELAAEARLQRAGLLVELAGRGKGTWKDVDLALAEAEKDAPYAQRATVQLMRSEVLYQQRRFEESLAAAEQLLAQFPDVTRESISAKTVQGAALCQLERFDEASACFQEVLNQEIGRVDKFGAHEPRARAMYWLGWIAMQRRDEKERQRYVEMLREEYPDRVETEAALRTLQPARNAENPAQPSAQ